MLKKILMTSSIIGASILYTGCASKINSSQENELKSYEAKGLYVEEKSVGAAAAL